MQLIQKQKFFFLNTVKRAAVGFAAFLLTIFFLSSCTINPVVDIVFSLTKGGSEVNTSTPLVYGDTYLLTVRAGSDASISTADYKISFYPANAFTINSQNSNSIKFTVNNGDATTATFTANHKQDATIVGTLSVSFKSSDHPTTTFQQDIENATTVPNLISANHLTRDVLEPLGAISGAALVKRYVTENGTGAKNGSSWANAWDAANLRNNIAAISDASANKVYLIMIAGGTYKPDYSSSSVSRTISFAMKNHVAIMGGFQAGGGWGRTGTTIFSGDINNNNILSGNSYHVFKNSGTLNNAHLYGVTIIGGNADSSGVNSSGGGMYNHSTSPNLTDIVFSDNTANNEGGGMYNDKSSPVLNNIMFSNNSAARGGGMINNQSSTILNGVMFIKNTASYGGGMYNLDSNLFVRIAVFHNNTAADKGGGMFNSVASGISTPTVIIGAVFKGNSAQSGGAMYNNHNGSPGPYIVNTIFSGNTLTLVGGHGPDIFMDLDASGSESINIAGSVLGIGLAQATRGIVGHGGSETLIINYTSLANTSVNFGANTTTGLLTYPTITSSSSARDLGLFVRRGVSGSTVTYYFSTDNSTWYTGFSSTGNWGSSANLPAGTEDLNTTADFAGNPRNGRPDAGLHELQ